MLPENAFGEPMGSTNTEVEKEDEVVEETPSLRDDLETAIATAEADAGEDIERAQDTPQERAPKEDKPPQEADSGTDQAYPDDTEKYPTLTAERAEKPPEGWRPAAREGFAELPEATRREIHRRELDIQGGLAQAADARRFTEQFEKTMTPFKALIASEGANSPMEAIESLMQTTAVLNMGSPQQKAQRFSQLATHYGIDLDELDTALAAQISGAPQQNDPVQQAIDQRMRPVEEFMQNINGQIQQTQQTATAEVQQEVSTWANGKEFIEDVRLDMADLLDMAKNRGRSMSLDEAYETAVKMNPEVARVIARRSEQENAGQRRQTVAQKVAASSVSRSPNQVGSGAPMNPNGDGTIRGALLASINQLENPD